MVAAPVNVAIGTADVVVDGTTLVATGVLIAGALVQTDHDELETWGTGGGTTDVVLTDGTELVQTDHDCASDVVVVTIGTVGTLVVVHTCHDVVLVTITGVVVVTFTGVVVVVVTITGVLLVHCDQV